MDAVGEGERGKSSMETRILPTVEWMASEDLLCGAGRQDQVLCDSLEYGMDGRWEGGGRGRGHMYTCG